MAQTVSTLKVLRRSIVDFVIPEEREGNYVNIEII